MIGDERLATPKWEVKEGRREFKPDFRVDYLPPHEHRHVGHVGLRQLPHKKNTSKTVKRAA
jgi:hypothetical protein